jgi:MFS family permease
MVDHASWRWVFYLAAMLAGFSGLIQAFFYFPPNFHQLHSKLSKREAIRQLDYGGAIIFAGSATCLLLGVSWGGQRYRMFISNSSPFSL